MCAFECEKKHKFLISWYGIADLKASISLESDGPILSVLKTKKFTDAIILSYTMKNLKNVDIEEQNEYIQYLKDDIESKKSLKSKEISDIINSLANTPNGHDFYFSWLEKEAPRDVDIKKVECILEKLNDSHAIYMASLEAISNVRKRYGDQVSITLFISPGTPVMAFSWALAALVNSDMHIDILTFSDISKPPEMVDLPYKLTDSSLKNTNLTHPDNFDVIFHLYGEQPMPAALGIVQFRCNNHVFVSSKGYGTSRLEHLLKGKNEYFLNVDAFSPQITKNEILELLQEHPEWEKIGFNLTGGTKLMYAGALAACNQCFGVPFYFETKNHNLIWLSDNTSQEIVGFKKVDDYFRLSNNIVITKKGCWEDEPIRELRKEITLKLWDNRKMISQIYKSASEYNEYPGCPFKASSKNISVSLDENKTATLIINNERFSIPECPDFAKYISGGWLEEYCYMILKPLVEQGEILDIRIGVEIGLNDREKSTIQEFDVVFTDGKQLYILECKAGTGYKSEDIQKLQNNVRNYAGVDGVGALIACSLPHWRAQKIIFSRIENSNKRLAMFIDEAVAKLLPSKIKQISGKGIYNKEK